MAATDITYINTTAFKFGVNADETAINIESIEVTTKPEFIDSLIGKDGHSRAEARGAAEQEITLKGEVGGSTGIMAATFYAAVTIANSTTYYGGSGVALLNEAAITEERQGWKKGTWKLQRKAGIAAV
jgi:hypothetical protein